MPVEQVAFEIGKFNSEQPIDFIIDKLNEQEEVFEIKFPDIEPEKILA